MNNKLLNLIRKNKILVEFRELRIKKIEDLYIFPSNKYKFDGCLFLKGKTCITFTIEQIYSQNQDKYTWCLKFEKSLDNSFFDSSNTFLSTKITLWEILTDFKLCINKIDLFILQKLFDNKYVGVFNLEFKYKVSKDVIFSRMIKFLKLNKFDDHNLKNQKK
ncbi:hypothetical protein GVAV_002941 [Gurleya vavrai]